MTPVLVAIDEVRLGRRSFCVGLRLALQPGAVTLLTGRVGAGKSVLLSMLSGWSEHLAGLAPQGEVVLAGRRFALDHDVRAHVAHARERVAYLGHRLFEESLGVTLGEELELVLGRFEEALPDPVRVALDLIRSVAARTVELVALGDGLRQLLALVDVVGQARDVDLILLDEPTSYVGDAALPIAVELLRWAATANPAAAILVATHDRRLLDLGFTAVELKGERSTPRELDPEILARAFDARPPLEPVGIELDGRIRTPSGTLPWPMQVRVEPEESLHVQGRNGAGKTHLLLALGGLLSVRGRLRHWTSSGRVSRRALYPRHLGMVFQEPHAYELRRSVRELLAPAPWLDAGAAAATQALSGAVCAAYDISPEDEPRTLSSGQLRLAWLVSQVGWATRWILDELDAALDPAALRLVTQIVAQHTARGGTFVSASHVGSLASVDGRIHRLERT